MLDQWRSLNFISVFVLCLASLIHFRFIEDSPRLLACARGKYFVARQILEKIANFNRQKIFCETLEGEKIIGYTENTGLFTNDFSDSSTSEMSEKSKIRVFNFQSGPK